MPSKIITNDTLYKSLFSDKGVVKSLLCEFVPEKFVDNFDFTTLERCNSSYVSADFRERRNDIIWRLRWKETWCYIYLMIEFQSSDDHWMALRMLAYTALLWDDLIKTGTIKTNDKLPPIFPIVLYNGTSPWNAPVELSDLIHSFHQELNSYQPIYKYYIIDEKQIPSHVINNAKGGASYIVRVEQAYSRDKIIEIAVDFDRKSHDTELANIKLTMFEWMDDKLKQFTANVNDNNEILTEEKNMLSELIAKYKQPYIDEGYTIGRHDGYTLGKDEGYSLGKNEGYFLGEAGGMQCVIKDILTEKFGPLPLSLEREIATIQDTARLRQLSRVVYAVNSLKEVSEFLKTLG